MDQVDRILKRGLINKMACVLLVTKVQRLFPHELNANRLILNLVVSDKSVMHFIKDQHEFFFFFQMRTMIKQVNLKLIVFICTAYEPTILYRFK